MIYDKTRTCSESEMDEAGAMFRKILEEKGDVKKPDNKHGKKELLTEDEKNRSKEFNRKIDRIRGLHEVITEELKLMNDESDSEEFVALMYDDATFSGEDSYEIGTKNLIVCDTNEETGAQFGRRKMSLGSRSAVLIGRVAVKGVLSITAERLDSFVKCRIIPLFAAQLRARLCAL